LSEIECIVRLVWDSPPGVDQVDTEEEDRKKQDGYNSLVYLLRFYFERKMGLKRPMVLPCSQTLLRSASGLRVSLMDTLV